MTGPGRANRRDKDAQPTRKVASAGFVVGDRQVAGLLVDDSGGWSAGLMMAVFVAVSALSTWALPETKGTSLRAGAVSTA